MNTMIMPDIPRIYTALAEWLACMIFIFPIKKRFQKWQTVQIVAAGLIIQSIFLVLSDKLSVVFWIPCMALAVGLMIGLIAICCELRWMDAVYYGMIAFVLAEFMASLEWQIICYTIGAQYPAKWLLIILLFIIYGIISLITYRLLRGCLTKDGKLDICWREFFSAVLITVAVFAMSNFRFLSLVKEVQGEYSYEIGNIRTLVDFGGLAMLFAYLSQCSDLRVRKELEAVQNVLQNQYVQYKQSRESIELINYKYHDLKHQIAYLRSEEDPVKRQEFLDRMENEIRQYEAQNKTGNKVLDTVLTTKSLYCAKHGITFTCVADGTLLNFMDVMDICSIFGNALDNAIESEMKIHDKEKRLIHVTVSRQKNFILMEFENYFEDELKYQEGILVTTKKEKEYHGYGIKSIQYIVNKYEGAVNIEANENWFSMKILIPMPKTEEATCK